jgi:hypothetical protein
MVVCFAEELYASRIGQFPETGQHVRAVLFELLQQHTGQREGDPESAVVAADRIQQDAVGRQVAFRGHPVEQEAVRRLVFIDVNAIDVKEAVTTQPAGLMELKIQTDDWHDPASSTRAF